MINFRAPGNCDGRHSAQSISNRKANHAGTTSVEIFGTHALMPFQMQSQARFPASPQQLAVRVGTGWA
jgi:hypothetical protein